MIISILKTDSITKISKIIPEIILSTGDLINIFGCEYLFDSTPKPLSKFKKIENVNKIGDQTIKLNIYEIFGDLINIQIVFVDKISQKQILPKDIYIDGSFIFIDFIYNTQFEMYIIENINYHEMTYIHFLNVDNEAINGKSIPFNFKEDIYELHVYDDLEIENNTFIDIEYFSNFYTSGKQNNFLIESWHKNNDGYTHGTNSRFLDGIPFYKFSDKIHTHNNLVPISHMLDPNAHRDIIDKILIDNRLIKEPTLKEIKNNVIVINKPEKHINYNGDISTTRFILQLESDSHITENIYECSDNIIELFSDSTELDLTDSRFNLYPGKIKFKTSFISDEYITDLSEEYSFILPDHLKKPIIIFEGDDINSVPILNTTFSLQNKSDYNSSCFYEWTIYKKGDSSAAYKEITDLPELTTHTRLLKSIDYLIECQVVSGLLKSNRGIKYFKTSDYGLYEFHSILKDSDNSYLLSDEKLTFVDGIINCLKYNVSDTSEQPTSEKLFSIDTIGNSISSINPIESLVVQNITNSVTLLETFENFSIFLDKQDSELNLIIFNHENNNTYFFAIMDYLNNNGLAYLFHYGYFEYASFEYIKEHSMFLFSSHNKIIYFDIISMTISHKDLGDYYYDIITGLAFNTVTGTLFVAFYYDFCILHLMNLDNTMILGYVQRSPHLINYDIIYDILDSSTSSKFKFIDGEHLLILADTFEDKRGFAILKLIFDDENKVSLDAIYTEAEIFDFIPGYFYKGHNYAFNKNNNLMTFVEAKTQEIDTLNIVIFDLNSIENIKKNKFKITFPEEYKTLINKYTTFGNHETIFPSNILTLNNKDLIMSFCIQYNDNKYVGPTTIIKYKYME